MPVDRIIRWGIPGWILLAWLLILYSVTYHEQVFEFLKNDSIESLSITAVFASVGVPIGYLIHELYFLVTWTSRNLNENLDRITTKVESFPYPDGWEEMNDKEKYYFIEFLWDKHVHQLEDEGHRNALIERYRGRLTLIHSLGTLFISTFCAIIITILVCIFFIEFSVMAVVILLLQIGIAIFVYKNFKYHSDHLKDYQGHYLNDLIVNSKKQ